MSPPPKKKRTSKKTKRRSETNASARGRKTPRRKGDDSAIPEEKYVDEKGRFDLIEALREEGIEIPNMTLEELEKELRQHDEIASLPEELKIDLAELEKELGMSISEVDLDLSKLPGLEDLGLEGEGGEKKSGKEAERGKERSFPSAPEFQGLENLEKELPPDEELDRMILKSLERREREARGEAESKSDAVAEKEESPAHPAAEEPKGKGVEGGGGPSETPDAGGEPSGMELFRRAVRETRRMEQSEEVQREIAWERRSRELETKLERMERLLDVSRGLSSILDLDSLLTRVVDAVIEITGMMRGFLMLVDDQGALRFRIGRDREGDNLPESEFHVSMTVVSEVERKARSLYISDMPEEDRFKDQQSVVDLDLKTAVCVPLQSGRYVTGILYADSKYLSEVFSERDMDLLEAYAGQAAVAIENAKLHGRLVDSKTTLERENIDLKQEVEKMYSLSGLVGRSKALRDIFDLVRKLDGVDSSVLIRGETGTGKELVAKALHQNSRRHERDFVPINCGALPENLLESELFGHKKGAFTGATEDKTGLFEVAHGGTLFLDEVAELPANLQVKLLRALQDGEIRRVGDSEIRKVDVRVISATNQDLEHLIAEGRFRQDLFFRLNVVPVTIPPLRERREDILPLAEHFIRKNAEKRQIEPPRLDPSAARALLQNAWKGNVRELENLIERAMALSGDARVIRREDLPVDATGPQVLGGATAVPGPLKTKVEAYERAIIAEALERSGGKVARAADELGLTRQSLHNKIKKYGIGLEND
jgi:Nif-specific regulatory protein